MILSRFGWWMLMVSVAVLPLGCSAFDDDNDDDRDDAKVESRDDIPEGANRVVQGSKGEDINWKAKADGTVYLVDRDSDRVVYIGSIRDGNRLEVDVSKGRVTNNDKEVTPTRKINDENAYNVYFVEK